MTCYLMLGTARSLVSRVNLQKSETSTKTQGRPHRCLNTLADKPKERTLD